ncbi:hypothetical protein [Variovorax sp. dw_954]|uniref:hypothetical protein n=1 Tax=Variovorax sp. dw_954 TaxID=2720078 RepID=UPI001BD563CF|nr:hypothetical protein [Variovorax sp. dw_954]
MNTKRIVLSVAILLGGFATFIPGLASAASYDHHHHVHEVCHYDHHHHRSCHWVH